MEERKDRFVDDDEDEEFRAAILHNGAYDWLFDPEEDIGMTREEIEKRAAKFAKQRAMEECAGCGAETPRNPMASFEIIYCPVRISMVCEKCWLMCDKCDRCHADNVVVERSNE